MSIHGVETEADVNRKKIDTIKGLITYRKTIPVCDEELNNVFIAIPPYRENGDYHCTVILDRRKYILVYVNDLGVIGEYLGDSMPPIMIRGTYGEEREFPCYDLKVTNEEARIINQEIANEN